MALLSLIDTAGKGFDTINLPPLLLTLDPSTRKVLGIGLLIIFPFLVNYIVAWAQYHWQQIHKDSEKRPQLPPAYPTLIPFSNLLCLAFDPIKSLERITQYRGKLASTRLSVLGRDVYFLQERETVAALWRAPDLSSPMISYIFALKYLCGMENKALKTYYADDSGSLPKPYRGSSVEPHNRVDLMIHQTVQKGLVGQGLLPMSKRLTGILSAKFDSLPISNDACVEQPDFLRFIYDILGSAIIESICGPAFLKINPNFMQDFWVYDKNIPWFARAVPSFILPEAHRTRKRLHENFKAWYAYARQNFTEESVSPDGYSDPFWGTEIMRSRQKELLGADNQDDDSLAASDLGLLWAAVSNILGGSTWAATHMYHDPHLLHRVRTTLSQDPNSTVPLSTNPKKYDKNPLLSAVYAETLRLYAKSYVTASSPYNDVKLGKWWLPKGEQLLVNSHISQMDEGFWNTDDGAHPLDTFWADRFLYDPKIPSSGPVKASARAEVKMPEKKDVSAPYFSLDGLEAAWIPYGGGHKKCPGRFLAKTIINLTCATLATDFDIEIMSEVPGMSPWKFGMGILRPKCEMPFRIRRRRGGGV